MSRHRCFNRRNEACNKRDNYHHIHCFVVALSAGGKFPISDSKLIDSFSAVVITVVGFYFGSKRAIELLKIMKGGEEKKTEEPKSPQGGQN